MDFLPLLSYFVGERYYGDKIGLILSVSFSVLVLVIYKVTKVQIPRLFYLVSALAIVFGVIDFFLNGSPFLIKYESVLTNFITGAAFLLSIKKDGSIIQDVSIKQGYFEEKDLDKSMIRFFKIWTLTWVSYFFLKAFIYFWIADYFGYKEGFFIRLVIGSTTFYALLFASIFGGKTSYFLFSKLGLIKS